MKMKAVLQRVKNASVTIDGNVYSSIGAGMLVLFCVEKDDTEDKLDWFASKISSLRCFEDENEKMNRSIKDIKGELLVVSQFTLAADCKKGTRPGFDRAEQPDIARAMYEKFILKLKENAIAVKTGVFAAMMEVSLVNDGPVTFVLTR